MKRQLLSTVSAILLIAFPINATSAAVGLVQPAGAVLLNGSTLNQQSAIFNGDVVQTSAKATAVVTSQLLVANLAENSRLELSSDGLRLRSGVVVIKTEKNATTKVAGTNITAGRGSRFVVRSGPQTTQIAALAGDLRVMAGNETVVVPAGKGVAVTAFDEDNSSGKSSKKNVGWLNNADLGTLILIGGGVAAGVGLGLYNVLKDDSVSPSAP